MRSLVASLSCLAVLLLTASGASAQTGSEFDQYVPQVPEADNPVPLPDVKDESGQGNGQSDDGPSGDQPAETPTGEPVAEPTQGSPDPLGELESEGPEGKALAGVAANTGSDGDSGGGGRPGGRVALGAPSGTSPAASLFGLAGGTSGEGMGAALPLLLVLTLCVVIGYALRRRRM
jgi:hypothetical protein